MFYFMMFTLCVIGTNQANMFTIFWSCSIFRPKFCLLGSWHQHYVTSANRHRFQWLLEPANFDVHIVPLVSLSVTHGFCRSVQISAIIYHLPGQQPFTWHTCCCLMYSLVNFNIAIENDHRKSEPSH